MPAAPPDAAASTSARHRADENRDNYPADARTLTPEFQRHVAHRELARRTPEARQIPRPTSPAIPEEFSDFLYPACAECHLIQNTTPVVILSVPIPIGTRRTST